MKHSLISSYGTIPSISDPKFATLDPANLCNVFRSTLELRLDHEECNYHTSNTCDVSDVDLEIDWPLHEYTPLPDSGYIRLLTFRVAEIEQSKIICGQLKHYSFEEAVESGYEALSYAWGNPYRTHHLLCKDGERNTRIPITANLADWFRHIEEGTYTIWIDAICIDQTNKVERSHQVAQMQQIYRNAEVVLAWVGGVLSVDEGGSTSDSQANARAIGEIRALVALHEFQEDLLSYGLGYRWSIKRNGPLNWQEFLKSILGYLRIRFENFRGSLLRIYRTRISTRSLSNDSLQEWAECKWYYTAMRHRRRAGLMHPVVNLLRRLYFTRRWVSRPTYDPKNVLSRMPSADRVKHQVVQELSSASSSHQIVYQWGPYMLNAHPILMMCSATRATERLSDPVRAILDLFFQLSQIPTEPSMSGFPSINFLRLAERVHGFDCLDPLDRIFALIGLYPQLEFQVDYSKSVQEAYVSFAAHLVTLEPQCLPTLLASALLHPSCTTSGWPTWVPDWRVNIPRRNVKNRFGTSNTRTHTLPEECVGSIAVNRGHIEILTACGFYIGFIAGPCFSQNDLEECFVYPVVTESGLLATVAISQEHIVLAGDFVFDMDRLFILREASNNTCRLVADSPLGALALHRRLTADAREGEKRLREILNWSEASANETPLSFEDVCSRVRQEQSRLHEAFGEKGGFERFMRTCGNPTWNVVGWETYNYADRPEFPSSQCLAVFDIV